MEGILSFVLVVVIVVLGILYCFWGYRYLRISILIYAFVTGFLFVNGLLTEAAPEFEAAWLVALAAGIVLALLSFFFIKFCIFIAGGMAGLLIFNIVRDLNPAFFAGKETIYVFLIGLIFFVVAGALTLAAKKHLLIIFSAIFGSYSMVYAAGILIGLVINPDVLRTTTLAEPFATLAPNSVFSSAPSWALILPVVVFSIAGIITQYRFTSRKK